MRRTSSGRSISVHPGQNGRCSQNIEKSQSQNAQTFGYVYQNTNGPKSWSSMEDPVVPLERNLHGHPLAGLLWEREFEKILLKYGWERVPYWECLFVNREKGLLLRRITHVFFQSSFQQEFLSMSSEFTFGDNSDKSSI